MTDSCKKSERLPAIRMEHISDASVHIRIQFFASMPAHEPNESPPAQIPELIFPPIAINGDLIAVLAYGQTQ